MNFKTFFEKNWYYLAVLVGFVALGLIYFSPILKGKTLPQMDDIHAKAAAQELVQYKAQTGEDALWTDSMFGGMPAYQIKGATSHSVFVYLNRALRLGLPYGTVALIFLYLLGFFVLLKSLKFDTWISIAGAVAFAFASYNIIIIGAGHVTKAYAIAFMAPTLAGVILTYRGKWAAGALLTLLGFGLEVAANHPQIAYYLGLIVLIVFISEFVFAILNKTLAQFGKATGILAAMMMLAILPNITTLWTTYEYGKETIRGGSDLAAAIAPETEKKSDGLDKTYALQWSYGIKETATILIPDFYGGSSTEGFDKDSKTYQVLRSQAIPNAEQIAQHVAYWGDMPFTSGPVYFGAVIMFFFILGLFVVENRYRWWILAAVLLSFFLSWGKNWEWFTDLFFYYMPLYNKFRTVSMALVMANVLVVLMAALAIKAIMDGKAAKEDLKRYATISFAVVGGFSLVFALVPGLFLDFKSVNDPTDFPNWLMNAILDDRATALRSDAFRSLVFSVLAFGGAWLLIDKKIKQQAFGIMLVALMLFDLWPVAQRYVNNDQFVTPLAARKQFTRTAVDDFILKDTDPNYRVLNLTRNPWNDAYTSYYHKSLGGYHGAKLGRYQELIENQLSRNNQQVINMLNAKYIITQDQRTGEPVANINFDALGNAWFVHDIEWVNNAAEEMRALNTFNPAKTAIVDKRFEAQLKDLKQYEYVMEDTGRIALLEYKPDYLKFESDNKNEQLAVFSEIYYPEGWTVKIDGEEKPYLRANYVLRALRVPAGKHIIEWKFDPASHRIGQQVATISSVVAILLILGMIYLLVKEQLPARKEE